MNWNTDFVSGGFLVCAFVAKGEQLFAVKSQNWIHPPHLQWDEMFECPNFFWPVELYSYKVFFLFKDLVCPRCDSGFIEEVSEDSRYSSVLVRKLTFWFLKNCFTQIFFTLLSSLLQNSSTSSSSEESDSLFSEVCPYNKQRWTKNSPPSLWPLFDIFASLVSLWAMAAAVYGALCSAVASTVLGVRPRWRRAGICGSEPSISGVARRRWGPRARVSIAAWTGEVPQVWAKTCSGRVCGNGTQKLWQCLNHFVCQLSYICSFFMSCDGQYKELKDTHVGPTTSNIQLRYRNKCVFVFC